MEAVEETRSIRPDLVLMNRQRMPEAEVIVISQNDPKVAARQARGVNARGYVSKSELAQRLLPMIRTL